MLTLSPPLTPVQRRRPKAEADRQTKARHIEAATRLWGSDLPAAEIASRYRITRTTLYRWAALALTYEGPEADALRDLYARGR